jgi:hypothetical protein
MDCDLADLVIKALALLGGTFALYRWHVAQKWQRYQQLDKYIAAFEANKLIFLATQVLDWKVRNHVLPEGKSIPVTSHDVVLALRVHTEPDSDGKEVEFSEAQAKIRDALDAILAFFGRLESAIANRFIDEGPTIAYFGYWLHRLYTVEEHENADPLVASKMRAYERAYGPSEMSNLYGRISERG